MQLSETHVAVSLLCQSASTQSKCRQVGMAAPVCVAMIAEGGGDRENTLSEVYGGKGDAKSGANPLYEAIGDVSLCLLASVSANISRTLRIPCEART